ncbi:BPSL0761 family protein [Prosthecobacter sp.]|uniref:BPSL0761 family protein n=1 Tax=Prosthecobacter sp. TaxID=1965333 RepID=UPI003782D33A
MTTPHERTRALLWAGGFLIELARDTSLPISVRQRAIVIARHFPTIEDVSTLSEAGRSSGSECGLTPLSETPIDSDDLQFGPLRYSTRLEWPEVPESA